MAYWISNALLETFDRGVLLGDVAKPRQGMATSNNNRFLRLWYEIIWDDICFHARNTEEAMMSHKKWFPYNKGGSTRKWYGNNDYLINWGNDGQEVKAYASELYKCITMMLYHKS